MENVHEKASTMVGGLSVEDSPVASRIDMAPTLVLEENSICELMLESRVRHPPILYSLVQVEAEDGA